MNPATESTAHALAIHLPSMSALPFCLERVFREFPFNALHPSGNEAQRLAVKGMTVSDPSAVLADAMPVSDLFFFENGHSRHHPGDVAAFGDDMLGEVPDDRDYEEQECPGRDDPAQDLVILPGFADDLQSSAGLAHLRPPLPPDRGHEGQPD